MNLIIGNFNFINHYYLLLNKSAEKKISYKNKILKDHDNNII